MNRPVIAWIGGEPFTTIDEIEHHIRHDGYQPLLDCYLSGQIPEAAWVEHLEDREFAAWVETRVKPDVSKREVRYLVAGLAVAFVVGVLLWVLS